MKEAKCRARTPLLWQPLLSGAQLHFSFAKLSKLHISQNRPYSMKKSKNRA